MTTPTPANPSEQSGGVFVRSAGPLPKGINVALPRFENSTAEDALAVAANRGTGEAHGRLLDSFPKFRFDIASTTTDDNRFAIFEHALQPQVETAGAVGPVATVLSRDLVRAYGCPVQVDTQPVPEPLAWHRFDRLVVQLRNSSTWAVHEPSELSPLADYSDEEPAGALLWEGELAADQAMYIPRGWPATLATTSGGDDLIVVTIMRWTGLDILGQLVDAGGHWPLLRADAPVDIAAHTDSYDGHLYRENHFGDLLAELASIEQVDSSLARLQVAVDGLDTPGEARPATPSELDVTAALRLHCPTGVKWVSGSPTSFTVAVAGLMLDIGMEALPAFAEVASGEPFRVTDLPLTATADGAKTLVSELAALGLIQTL